MQRTTDDVLSTDSEPEGWTVFRTLDNYIHCIPTKMVDGEIWLAGGHAFEDCRCNPTIETDGAFVVIRHNDKEAFSASREQVQ